MFRTLVNAWKVKDIRTKILFTLLLLLVYRFGSFIPVPGVDANVISEFAGQYDMLSFLNLLSGGAFGEFSIFAMGISPYITGSIIIQLLTIAIPALEKLSKDEDGRKKMEKISRYVGIGLAMVQSIGIIAGLQNSRAGVNVLLNNSILTYITIGLVCTAGTAFLVWMGEMITEKGVGNGVSIIIFASIAARIPTVAESYVRNFFTGVDRWWFLPLMIIGVLLIVGGVTFIEKSERRIPVQYAKRVVGRKLYGGQSTHIPLKANANGVMPLIFAMTIMQFPAMIGQFWPNSGFYKFYQTYMSASSDNIVGPIVYYVIYALLILGFAYFYTTISFHPGRDREPAAERRLHTGYPSRQADGRASAEDQQQAHALRGGVPDHTRRGAHRGPRRVRQGELLRPHEHTDHGQRRAETSQQLDSMMLMRHYKGFLN